MTAISSPSHFTRDRFTWSAYILLGFYAYMQASLGPIMPFVSKDLSLNYTVTGLHLTAFAAGMVIAGFTGANASHRFGRWWLFWGGGIGMCVGSILFMTAPIAPLTIFGTFLMGFLGTYLLVMIQSTLADHYPDQSDISLTEANIVASIFAAIAPIVVGLGATLFTTWRLSHGLGIALLIAVFVLSHRTPLPVPISSTDNTQPRGKLPRVFWLYALMIFFSVSLEWCIIFWSADFLDKVVQLPTEQASTISGVFLFAMFIGRLSGSRLTHYYKPRHLLWVAIALIAIGFPMFWLGEVDMINIIGLGIIGLGVSNLFPFLLAIASRVGKQASDLASSRVSMSAGLAILILPQVLGSTADMVGIFNALTIVPVILSLLVLFTFIAARLRAT